MRATAQFPGDDAVSDHPGFWYAILSVRQNARIETCWLVQSADFNHLATRAPSRAGGVSLTFSPRSDDDAARFVVPPEDLGPRLASLARDSSGAPSRIPGALLLARREDLEDQDAGAPVPRQIVYV